MLVTFSFKNFGPFREEACLDLRAAPAYKDHEYNLARSSLNEGLLKVVAVYGANAAGKTKLVDAYRAFTGIVQQSFSRAGEGSLGLQPGEASDMRPEPALRRYYDPFIFSTDGAREATEFEATYDVEEGQIRYGFSFDGARVISEWLYLVKASTGRQNVLLEREGSSFDFGASVRGECERYAPNIADDTLALSFLDGVKLKTPYFRMASTCVLSVLPIPSLSTGMTDGLIRTVSDELMDDSFHGSLVEFLKGIDVCVEDISVERNGNRAIVFAHHVGADGEEYRVPISIESEGTRKAIVLFYFLSVAINSHGAVMVDELSSALHPLLVRALVTQFHREGVRGQIIFTTHDTSLLDRRYLRRDQAWFVDKNSRGESELYCLSDFKLRNDASYTKSYLSGMFGAIPNLKEFVLGGGDDE